MKDAIKKSHIERWSEITHIPVVTAKDGDGYVASLHPKTKMRKSHEKKRSPHVVGHGTTEDEATADLFLNMRGHVVTFHTGDWNTPWI